MSADDPAASLDRYEVGGAVRDALLGRPVNDRDWVVVGSTPQQMVALGFRPVGRDFPVFLHPRTHEEFALARTERKTAPGYRGFIVHCAPDVTLEDDLRRRDLTINAIARTPDGRLVDPWGGERDLHAGVLRHVSEAFAEDPVRILRLARFAARFTTFGVAPETTALMRTMVAAGEVDALVPERVWQEWARGLMEAKPSRMLAVLRECGALARLLPELPGRHAGRGGLVDAGPIVDAAAAAGASLETRFAALLLDLGAGDAADDREARARAERAARRVKAPNDCRDLAMLAAGERRTVQAAERLPASALLALVERTDAIRKPARFTALLAACEADARGREGAPASPRPAGVRALRAAEAARAVDAGALAAAVRAEPDDGAPLPDRIRTRVHAHRQAAVAAALRAL